MTATDNNSPELPSRNETIIDVTDRILPHYSAEQTATALAKHREGLTPSSNPQAVLMFAKLAAYHAKQIDKEREDDYDFSHPINFQALGAPLVKLRNTNCRTLA